MVGSVLCVGQGWASELPRGTHVVETAADGVGTIHENDGVGCIVCVCDAGGGVDAVRTIREADPSAPILAVSDRTDGDLAIGAVRAGATEYVSRDRLAADGEAVTDRIGSLAADGSRRPEAELRRQTDALERLYQITSDRSRSFERKVTDLLELGCDRLGLRVGYLSEIDGDRFRLIDGRGIEELFGSVEEIERLGEDGSLPLDRTYCHRTVREGELCGFARGVEGTDWDGDGAVEVAELGAYLGGPVFVDGELHGTLCFADSEPRASPFSDAERTFVELTVEWLSHEFERRKYDTERREAAAELRRTFDRVSDAVFAVDDEWRFTHVNGHAEAILDRSAEELIGEAVWTAFPDAVGERYEREYRRAMRTQEPVSFESFYEPLDLWTEVNAYPSSDGLSVFFRDITDRKRRERTLRGVLETSRELFRAEDRGAIADIVVRAGVDVLGFGLNGVHLYDEETETLQSVAASEAVFDTVGYPPTYDVGEGMVGQVFEEGDPVVFDDIASVDGYDYGPIRSAIVVPLGSYGVFSVGSETPGAFDESDVSLAELLATSTTEALDRAERLRTLQTYETVLESVEDMIYVLDDEDRITYLTAPLSEWLGYDREALIGEPIATVLPDLGSAGVSAVGLSDASTRETTAETAAGERRPIAVTRSALSGDERAGRTVGSVADIGELTETRAELVSERERFRELFEQVPDPVVEATLHGDRIEVEAVNSAFESVFGYDESTLVGRSINDVLVPEADGETAAALDETIRREGVATAEVSRRTKTGTRQFLFRGFVYESGGVDRVFGIYTDVTERNERERYLRVTNRIIRHNLRNDLNIIKGFAEALLDDLDSNARAEYAERIIETAESLSELGEDANELRKVVGQNVGSELEPTGLEPHVEEACKRVTERFPAARIERSVPPGIAGRVDERFGTAVEYLVENAVEHNDADEPWVSVTAAESAVDGYVEVSVSDDGPGIPQTTRELILGDREITQLEHTVGIGLWVVKWVVESYGGEIRFGTSDAGGTRVTLRVPASLP